MKLQQTIRTVLIGVCFLLLGFIAYQLYYNDKNMLQTVTTVESVRDSLHVITTNPVIINTNRELRDYIKNDSIYKNRIDKLLTHLRNENKAFSNIITFQNKVIAEYLDTNRNLIVNTRILDTTIYPTYHRTLTKEFGDWIKGSITLGLDTFYFNPIITNDFNITTGTKAGQFYVDVQSMNPYSKTDNIRVFSKPFRKWGIGAGTGLAYLPVQNKVGLGIYLGIYYKLW